MTKYFEFFTLGLISCTNYAGVCVDALYGSIRNSYPLIRFWLNS